MAKGERYRSESRRFTDERTGARIRQVTNHPSIHHQPFFFVPAYDDAMRRLYFVSHRTGAPQIFAEERAEDCLRQLTDVPDLNEWSVYPSRGGRHVYFTAGSRACRVDAETLAVEELLDLSQFALREKGDVGAAMGTTALSFDDRFWAIRVSSSGRSRIVMLDLAERTHRTALERDEVAHMMFSPDDPGLLFYAGPLTDRVWCVRADGTGNRRLYERTDRMQWVTHESWLPGTGELMFVDWPRGMQAVDPQTGRVRKITEANAWHAAANRQGTRVVADTNCPDRGLVVFDPRESCAPVRTLCFPNASNQGAHWAGPFPYNDGPIPVYAPQHTHPHPNFSTDGRRVCYTSDATGHAQVYEVELPEEDCP